MIVNEPMPFGGQWSDRKLQALASYPSAYTTALRNTQFRLVYIDAFAGAGSRPIPRSDSEEYSLFVDEDLTRENVEYRHGSPLIAPKTQPTFHEFIFIEQDADSLSRLEAEVAQLPEAQGRTIQFVHGDANTKLLEITRSGLKQKGQRAVVFMDPFALQVDWSTIEAIAKTEAIDMWLLFPAMAVNRMLPKSGIIPEAWEARLKRLFGRTNGNHPFIANRWRRNCLGSLSLPQRCRKYSKI